MVWLHVFLISALGAAERATSGPGCITPVENPSTGIVNGLKVEPGTSVKRNVLSARSLLSVDLRDAISENCLVLHAGERIW